MRTHNSDVHNFSKPTNRVGTHLLGEEDAYGEVSAVPVVIFVLSILTLFICCCLSQVLVRVVKECRLYLNQEIQVRKMNKNIAI